MFTCSECEILSCHSGLREKAPQNCPINEKKVMEASQKEYRDDLLNFSRQAALTESRGYCHWNRVQEIIHFSREMGYEKMGVAFCAGLKNEARILAKIFRSHGFQVDSVICKNGALPKEGILGLREEEKVRPGQYESMCNPVGQAMLLNEAGTQFNVLVGLCVGHDSIFFKYSQAPVTVLVAKDRVLAHNPAGALYCAGSYFAQRLSL